MESGKQEYIVSPGSQIRAGGKLATEGQTIELAHEDALRLLAQGAIYTEGSTPGALEGAQAVTGATPPANEAAAVADDGTTTLGVAADSATESEVDSEALSAILEGTVALVTEELENLSDADLVELASLESAGKARRGVLEAIEAEQAARADEAAE